MLMQHHPNPAASQAGVCVIGRRAERGIGGTGVRG